MVARAVGVLPYPMEKQQQKSIFLKVYTLYSEICGTSSLHFLLMAKAG